MGTAARVALGKGPTKGWSMAGAVPSGSSVQCGAFVGWLDHPGSAWTNGLFSEATLTT